MLWLLLLLGGASLFVGGSGHNSVPGSARRLLPLLERWARERQIPLPVLLAWTKLESGFNPREYNPELRAMKRWACAVANAPEKWGDNPAYREAVEVCRLLSEGLEPSVVIARGLWGKGAGWGSYGLLQVSRQVASEVGYPYAADNAGLLDPETNIKLGTSEIVVRRKRLYGDRKALTAQEWSRVRAAYVGGPGIFRKAPKRAREIGAKFLVALRDLGHSDTSTIMV